MVRPDAGGTVNDKAILWIGGGGALLLLLLASKSGGASPKSVTGAPDPSVAQNVAGRWSFASSGFAGLAGVARSYYDNASKTALAAAQLAASESRDAANIRSSQLQAQAQMTAARQAARGRSGFSLGIPGLGAFSIHF